MPRLLAVLAAILLLGSIHAARAAPNDNSNDSNINNKELPAPDFGWPTLGIVVAGGAGATLIRRLRNKR
nr:hypothetical protein [uncultured Rhodopila sp.]